MKKMLSLSLLLVGLLAALPLRGARAGERFACDMHALSEGERTRHIALTHALFAAMADKRELPDGYAFRLTSADLPRAAEWVGREARCCPFFTFALEQSRDRGPLWLRVTGGDGIKPFIRAEFGI